MKVRFYSFGKRFRSTLQVSGTYNEVDCQLKESTSVTDPVLQLQTIPLVGYNYAYIPAWDRYYFVEEPVSVDNMVELVLHEDLLASFKTPIGNTSCMIKYATGSTKNIVDSRLPVLADVTINEEATDFTQITPAVEGDIIVGLTGKGSFGPYILEAPLLITEMLDGVDNWWHNEVSVSSMLEAAFQLNYGGSAAECFKSAFRIPFVVDKTNMNLEPLYLGNYPCKTDQGTAIKGYKPVSYIVTAHEDIAIPWVYSDWRRNQAYTDVMLYIPFIGVLNIPVMEIRHVNRLYIDFSLNITSGDIAVDVHIIDGTNKRKHVATGSGNCAMQTPFGSTGIDTGKLTQSWGMAAGAAVSAAVAAATGGASLIAEVAMFGSMAMATGLTVSALGGTGEGSAGLGGGATSGLDNKIRCVVVQKKFSDTQTNTDPIMGKPYMAIGTPNQFSGFVQTDSFQFADSKATSKEILTINNLLDAGIYYE